MEFANGIMGKAQRKLLGLARKQKLKPKDVTFVGIHVRKTDHAEFMTRQLNIEPLEDDYFNDATGEYSQTSIIAHFPSAPLLFNNQGLCNNRVFFLLHT